MSVSYTHLIGAGRLYKEIEKALVGLKKGEEKTVNVKMPKEIENKEIAGKKAEFNLKIKMCIRDR